MDLQSAETVVDSLLLRDKEKVLMLHNSIALAAGWLAREDKLTFEKDGSKIRVTVKPTA